MSNWDWGYYKSKPRIKIRGGIKSQSKRGSFAQSWWAKRWIAVLESFNIGARLNRGRSYARSGQVLSIEISKGLITSRVQGSRATPYEIIIKVKTLNDHDWERLAGSLSTQAIFAAKLLAGEMPQEIEAAFAEQKLSLFPEKLRDLETNCSCPDWSNPCKHIAAVYYLLGEEFDRDPFLIFKLRGATRDEFIKLLGASGATPSSRGIATEELPSSSEPLTTEGDDYWNGEKLPDDFFGDVRLPPVSAAGPKRLGNFPFWRGSENLLEAIEPVYKRVSQYGLDLFLGERGKN